MAARLWIARERAAGGQVGPGFMIAVADTREQAEQRILAARSIRLPEAAPEQQDAVDRIARDAWELAEELHEGTAVYWSSGEPGKPRV